MPQESIFKSVAWVSHDKECHDKRQLMEQEMGEKRMYKGNELETKKNQVFFSRQLGKGLVGFWWSLQFSESLKYYGWTTTIRPKSHGTKSTLQLGFLLHLK